MLNLLVAVCEYRLSAQNMKIALACCSNGFSFNFIYKNFQMRSWFVPHRLQFTCHTFTFCTVTATLAQQTNVWFVEHRKVKTNQNIFARARGRSCREKKISPNSKGLTIELSVHRRVRESTDAVLCPAGLLKLHRFLPFYTFQMPKCEIKGERKRENKKMKSDHLKCSAFKVQNHMCLNVHVRSHTLEKSHLIEIRSREITYTNARSHTASEQERRETCSLAAQQVSHSTIHFVSVFPIHSPFISIYAYIMKI